MPETKALTDAQVKALTVIHEAGYPGIMPSDFGALMWPETTNSGSNGSRGFIPDTGRNLSAGSFLSRLHKAGYVYRSMPSGTYYVYSLSLIGRKALGEHLGETIGLSMPADVRATLDAHEDEPTPRWTVIWEDEDGTEFEETVDAVDATDATMQAGAYEPGIISVAEEH